MSKHFLIQRVSPFDAKRNCAHSLEEQSQSGSAMRRVSLSLQLTRAFILRCRADAMSRKSTGVSFHFKVVVMARVGWGGAECIITRGCVLGPGDWFVTAEAGWMSNATRRSVCQTLPRPAESRPFKSLIIHRVSEVGPPPTMTNARLEPPGSVHGLPIAFHSGRGVRVSQPTQIPSPQQRTAHATIQGN